MAVRAVVWEVVWVQADMPVQADVPAGGYRPDNRMYGYNLTALDFCAAASMPTVRFCYTAGEVSAVRFSHTVGCNWVVPAGEALSVTAVRHLSCFRILGR